MLRLNFIDHPRRALALCLLLPTVVAGSVGCNTNPTPEVLNEWAGNFDAEPEVYTVWVDGQPFKIFRGDDYNNCQPTPTHHAHDLLAFAPSGRFATGVANSKLHAGEQMTYKDSMGVEQIVDPGAYTLRLTIQGDALYGVELWDRDNMQLKHTLPFTPAATGQHNYPNDYRLGPYGNNDPANPLVLGFVFRHKDQYNLIPLKPQ